MGVVTVSSSASRSPLGLSTNFSNHSSPLKRPLILAFKGNKRKNTTLISPPKESVSLPLDTSKKNEKRPSERVEALSTAEPLPTTSELDYNEAAAKLENLYKLSPPKFLPDTEDKTSFVKKQRGRRRRNKGIIEGDDKLAINVVRGRKRKSGRLSLDKRIELKNKKECQLVASMMKIKTGEEVEEEKINRLVRDYSASNDLVSLDWKKVKIPPVLPSSENAWLFKLMQPMKAILQTKDNLEKELQREPTDGEQAEATNMSVVQLRKHMEVGRAARNKLIKHNLRLVLFVINKYFQEFASGPKFQDLCQAGVKGLITAIDRFELKRKFRLSTYGLFWIRHAITRSMTVSSFMRVSFGLDSLRVEIQRAKLELLFELHRMPTEEEIIKKVKISPRRYHEVMNASRPVYSLHSRDKVTQEEFINGITDIDNDNGGGDNKRQSALLRLALDDVLDSLKPKESLVIRQRFGLDGKGDRTLGEIAGNLNISREMVRKYEVKGLMKLKHPTRVDYLRQHLSK